MLIAEPLIGPGDVDDVGQGEARDQAAQVDEGMALHGELLTAGNDTVFLFGMETVLKLLKLSMYEIKLINHCKLYKE